MIIISRESTVSGKNIIKFNGKSIVLSQLKKIREKLLDIHGQHQNQNLLNRSTHIFYLDEYIEEKINPLIDEFNTLREKYMFIKNDIERLSGSVDREKLIDYIKFQIEDIEKGKLKIGEEEE